MILRECFKNFDHPFGFVVVSRSNNNGIPAGGFFSGVRLSLLRKKILIWNQQFSSIPAAAQLGGPQTQLSHRAGITVDHQDFTGANGPFEQQPEAADEVGDDLFDAKADAH